MSEVTVRIEGMAELKDMLERVLPERLQGKALQGALAKAAQPIVLQARALAPVDSGRLRKAIYSKRSKYSRPGYESRIVAVRRGKKQQKKDRDAYYWKFVEFGHRTGARKGQYLQKEGRRSKGKAVEATGFVPAQPFMRPAFEANKDRALEIVRKDLAGQIQRVALRNQARLTRALRRSITGRL